MKTITIWNTKYALTEGIIKQEAKVCSDSMVDVGHGAYLHGEGKQWHRSRDSAVIRAEVMRESKIASLEKSLARIKALNFSPRLNGG